MSLPLIIPPAINVQDLDYWAEVLATPLHLLECLSEPDEDPSPLDRVLAGLENGHNCADCIDRETPRYCSGLYWPLWSCHLDGVTEEMVRAVWPDFPGFPQWVPVNESERK